MKTKIFKLDYLENAILTDSDLNYIFNGDSLSKSLLVGMFKFAGIKKKQSEIFALCKEVDWYDKYIWNHNQQADFSNKLARIYKNIYRYGVNKCTTMADLWILNYGFCCKD